MRHGHNIKSSDDLQATKNQLPKPDSQASPVLALDRGLERAMGCLPSGLRGSEPHNPTSLSVLDPSPAPLCLPSSRPCSSYPRALAASTQMAFCRQAYVLTSRQSLRPSSSSTHCSTACWVQAGSASKRKDPGAGGVGVLGMMTVLTHQSSQDIKKNGSKPSARPCEALTFSSQIRRGALSLQPLSGRNLSFF